MRLIYSSYLDIPSWGKVSTTPFMVVAHQHRDDPFLVPGVRVHRVTAKPGLWTLDWTMDWTMDWTGDDHYQFSEAEKSDE